MTNRKQIQTLCGGFARVETQRGDSLTIESARVTNLVRVANRLETFGYNVTLSETSRGWIGYVRDLPKKMKIQRIIDGKPTDFVGVLAEIIEKCSSETACYCIKEWVHEDVVLLVDFGSTKVRLTVRDLPNGFSFLV